jgi:hypothetical protein
MLAVEMYVGITIQMKSQVEEKVFSERRDFALDKKNKNTAVKVLCINTCT